jgi:hypothetical protein
VSSNRRRIGRSGGHGLSVFSSLLGRKGIGNGKMVLGLLAAPVSIGVLSDQWSFGRRGLVFFRLVTDAKDVHEPASACCPGSAKELGSH